MLLLLFVVRVGKVCCRCGAVIDATIFIVVVVITIVRVEKKGLCLSLLFSLIVARLVSAVCDAVLPGKNR